MRFTTNNGTGTKQLRSTNLCTSVQIHCIGDANCTVLDVRWRIVPDLFHSETVDTKHRQCN